METIDIVIVALRRNCIENLFGSMRKYFDYSGYSLRLVLHVDYLDSLARFNIGRCVKENAHMFEEYEIKYRKENVGHSRSFYWCMENVKNDYLYFEDDKVFYRDIKLSAIIARETDAVSLEGHRGRLGHCECYYAKKKIRDFLWKHYEPVETWAKDAESTNKLILKGKGFTYYAKHRTRCVNGTGMDNMAKNKLIRVRKGKRLNSPIYVPVPDNISYILHGPNEKRNAQRMREFFLCIKSFPVFNYENLNIDDIKTTHVGIMSRDCKVYARSTWLLDYDEIKDYDISGCLADSGKLFYIRTALFKQCYAERDNKDFGWIRLMLWLNILDYRWNEKIIRDWGFEVE